jgi:hypothetical protein
MRNRSHVPPNELLPSPFDLEFATPRLNATRRRTLNFELTAEPHIETSSPTEVGLLK